MYSNGGDEGIRTPDLYVANVLKGKERQRDIKKYKFKSLIIPEC